MIEKYDKIGINYNETRKADPYLVSRLYELLAPKSDNLYLDIGSGTGNYTIALHQKGIPFIGVEPADKMLEVARKKCSTIDWRKGKAEKIPLERQSVNGIIASLTIHHWQDLEIAFQELYRVLQPNSHLVIFTSTPKQMKGYWLNHYFPKMLEASILQMPSFELIQEHLQNSGFQSIITEKYFVQDDLQDLFLYAGKNKPEYYLHPMIRKGISSFSSLANLEEIKQGLAQLEKDISAQKMLKNIENYQNDEGDYLFVVCSK